MRKLCLHVADFPIAGTSKVRGKTRPGIWTNSLTPPKVDGENRSRDVTVCRANQSFGKVENGIVNVDLLTTLTCISCVLIAHFVR